MEYLLDTGNLEDIKYFNEKFPITGVTTNPTIIAIFFANVGKFN